MPIHVGYEKKLLDFLSGAAAAAAPGGRWLAFCTGSPNENGQSVGPMSAGARVTCTFAAANSPQGSITNLNAIVRTMTAIATVIGWAIYESSNAVAGGSLIAYGTCSPGGGCSCASGDAARFPAGSLVINLD